MKIANLHIKKWRNIKAADVYKFYRKKYRKKAKTETSVDLDRSQIYQSILKTPKL